MTADIDAQLARRLVDEQFPRWAGLAIRPVALGGVDNRRFRLGEELTVRLPSGQWYAHQVAKEQRWLPLLAPHLPLPIPAPVAAGRPGAGYPYPWSVYRWIPGLPAAVGPAADPVWFHGDVAVGNLLLRDGVLTAVIDFGTSGVGDPACDLAIAWTLMTGSSREAFRSGVALDLDTWARGRGWTLWKALIGLAGALEDDSPSLVDLNKTVITRVLADAPAV